MPPRRVRWTSLLRPLAALALLAWLIHRIGPRSVLDALALFHSAPGCVAAALALTFLALLAGAVRWHHLLRALALPYPFGTTFRAFFAGQFFNAFFFGACGGDLYRAYAAARRHPGREAEAAASVVIDRGIGLLATLAFGCLALLPDLRARLADPAWRKASWLMLLFALAGATATVAALTSTPWHLASRLLPSRVHPLLARLHTAFTFPRRNPRAAAIATLLSLANLLLLAREDPWIARAACPPDGASSADLYARFPANGLAVSPDCDVAAASARHRLFALPDRRARLAATPRFLLSTAFVTLPDTLRLCVSRLFSPHAPRGC